MTEDTEKLAADLDHSYGDRSIDGLWCNVPGPLMQRIIRTLRTPPTPPDDGLAKNADYNLGFDDGLAVGKGLTTTDRPEQVREAAASGIPDALWPFIQHDKDCVLRGHWMEASDHDCDCGLATALAALPPSPTPNDGLLQLLREARPFVEAERDLCRDMSEGDGEGMANDLIARIDAALSSTAHDGGQA